MGKNYFTNKCNYRVILLLVETSVENCYLTDVSANHNSILGGYITAMFNMVTPAEPSRLTEEQIETFKSEFDLNREQILEFDVIFKASAILLFVFSSV